MTTTKRLSSDEYPLASSKLKALEHRKTKPTPPESKASYRRAFLTFMAMVLLWYKTFTSLSQEVSNVNNQGLQARAHDSLAESRPAPNQSCSCYNSTAPKACCVRLYLSNHKFGYELSVKLFSPFRNLAFSPMDVQKLQKFKSQDYRHVVFGRNMYEAIVSGYLYHKSGRECWLDMDGEPRVIEYMKYIEQWYTFISLDQPFPSPRNRSLCRYIADESEEDGMRMYINVAIPMFYAIVPPYWTQVQNRIWKGENKTLRVCLEDVENPAKQALMFQQMMDWLYPGGHRYKIPFKPENYTGGHATSRDKTLRSRLLAMTQRMDENMFNKSLAKIQEVVRCPR